MENNANYAVVGALATAVIVALFAFVYWFAAPSANVENKPYDIVFTGTVSGVTRGTEVQFNGIKVGQVVSVALDTADSNRVIARVDVVSTAPVRADTRVQMGFQGLTGSGSIQFSGGTDPAGEPPIGAGGVPTLYAEVSNFQSILDGLASTVNGAATAVTRINTMLDENDARISSTLSNVETFSAALSANSDGIEQFLSSMSEVGAEIGPMAAEIKTLSADLRGLVEAIPPEQVTKAVGDITTFTDSLARNSPQIDQFFSTTTTLADNLTELSKGLSASVAVIDQVAAEIDPAIIGRVMANVDSFSNSLGGSAGQIDNIVANVNTFSDGMVAALKRVDAILARIDSSVSGDAGEGMFAEIGAAATSVKQLADQLNSSTSVLASKLNDFAAGGLSQYSALAVDARATLQRLDRVVRNLENNPQGLIFGGDTVREYNKR